MCVQFSVSISIKAVTRWNIHYCQGIFYFLKKKIPASLGQTEVSSSLQQKTLIWIINSELIQVVHL